MTSTATPAPIARAECTAFSAQQLAQWLRQHRAGVVGFPLLCHPGPGPRAGEQLGQELAHIVLVHRGQAGERDRRQRAQNGRQSRCSAFVGQQARPVHVQGLLRWST